MHRRPHFLIESKELSISSWQEIRQRAKSRDEKRQFLKSLKNKLLFIYLWYVQFWHVIQRPPVSSKCFANQNNNNNNIRNFFFEKKKKKIDTPFINKKKIKKKKLSVLWLCWTLWIILSSVLNHSIYCLEFSRANINQLKIVLTFP